ncbi:DapH/DapD/GlmU-related protein [Aureibaculum sp. 2210JD6-5]|uniref:acyltransferase n=1 Tax=Aureibaculum sp. 2210JD6-5 TaxID=3103957 RepID=UPI002AAEC8B7|nr:DapH/DapD/GlmU-related protein [Aureibaculum sp. 2210JD6-5]MDY7394418.1 DapH/DapD/GlmU-related protein [Aureibaculum sp. 2210JD6-5]
MKQTLTKIKRVKAKVSFKQRLDFFLFGWIINLVYGEYYRPKFNYIPYYKLFFHFLIPQKILRLNAKVKWPVHFTSVIINGQNIKKGILCDPGDNPNIYIEANNGIVFGSNVGIGSGARVLSSIHSHDDHSKHDFALPIIIGNNVFIGSNSVILPGVSIGDNVVIGAGSIVAKNIPKNSIALGNPCKVIKPKGMYIEDFSKITFNKKIPEKYIQLLNQNIVN